MCASNVMDESNIHAEEGRGALFLFFFLIDVTATALDNCVHRQQRILNARKIKRPVDTYSHN